MKNKKSLSIVGSVGIPANYGGWETLVENIVSFLSMKIDITVFCTTKKLDIKRKNYLGCNLEYININANGFGSIFYDAISIYKSLNKYDFILILGVSGGIFLPFLKMKKGKSKIILNVDGNESKRDKWNFFIKKFLILSEYLAVKSSDLIIADNLQIKKEIDKKYNISSTFIPYGGVEKKAYKSKKRYTFSKSKYAFTVCRIEPENNIHLILAAFSRQKKYLFVIVGNWTNSEYGRELKRKYNHQKNIFILDPIYNQNELNYIRSNASIYIHGHKVGGTNPSLVEAMSLKLPVFAFDINYNHFTTSKLALYFKNEEELLNLINLTTEKKLKMISNNLYKTAQKNYNWQKIADDYEKILS